MRRFSFGVLLIALSTLVLELMLTRVFDIVLVPNLAYFVVTAAVFSFGMAGIYVAEDVGGSALSRLDAVLIFEALAQGSADLPAASSDDIA